jgi:hypothetical protein
MRTAVFVHQNDQQCKQNNEIAKRIPSSGFLCRVALVKTDVLDFVFHRNVRRLLVTANVVAISPIVIQIIEALRSSETSVLARATQRNIPEDNILRSHSRENLKSYIYLFRKLRISRLLRGHAVA